MLIIGESSTLSLDFQVISQSGGINSTKYFIHNNHLGSVTLTTDANGVVQQGSQYLPCGAPANAQNSELQPYGFSAKERDASELMYFEARYYDPLSARFISPDPLFAAEMEKCIESMIECNVYQYTGNNPVNWLDLDGLDAQSIGMNYFYGMLNSMERNSVDTVNEVSSEINKVVEPIENAVKQAAPLVKNGVVTAAEYGQHTPGLKAHVKLAAKIIDMGNTAIEIGVRTYNAENPAKEFVSAVFEETFGNLAFQKTKALGGALHDNTSDTTKGLVDMGAQFMDNTANEQINEVLKSTESNNGE